MRQGYRVVALGGFDSQEKSTHGHKKLTFPFQGLDQKLTGVEPSRVVHEIVA